jgi:integrase
MHPLSTEETRRLLAAACGDQLEALYVLAVTTGMRRGELLGLKWSDIDLGNVSVSIRRTLTSELPGESVGG